MKLATWNVNGVRACAKKTLFEWLENYSPDVVCLQETKATEEQVIETLGSIPYEIHAFSAQRKGYSGVAVLIKKDLPLLKIQKGIGIDKFDCEGRFIHLEFEHLLLNNSYYPNGQRDHGRVPYKLEFSRAVQDYYKDSSKPVLLTGDFNTAHTEIDLARPKNNIKTTGFLPHERAWLDELLASGYVDAFREQNGPIEDHYTWWTYRMGCREKNIGWRLDYFFASSGLENQIDSCVQQSDVLGSDHCPVLLTLHTNLN